ncbi:MAG: hypothetical protein V1487_00610 [bacterium]
MKASQTMMSEPKGMGAGMILNSEAELPQQLQFNATNEAYWDRDEIKIPWKKTLDDLEKHFAQQEQQGDQPKEIDL